MKAQRPFNFDEAVLSQMENIRRIGLRRLRNRNEIDDFVQETILRAYAKRDQLRDETKFDRWIAAIANNLARDWNNKRREEPMDELPDIPDERTPHDILEREEERRELHQAMGRLNEDDREMLRARYFEDASYGELQQKYGLSYSAVGFRLHRAKARLKKILTSTAAAFLAVFAGMKRAAYAFGGILIMTKTTKIAVVVTAAVIAALLGFVLSLKQAHEAPRLDDSARMETGGAYELDETGQTPRIVNPTASTPDDPKPTALDANITAQTAAATASNATKGTAQEMTEDMTENDYSEHDTTDMANIGVLPLIVVKEVTYNPSDEDRQRREEIQKALLKMQALGHVSAEPKDGYAPWESENGEETLFVAEDVFSAFNALKKEVREIELRSTSTIEDRMTTNRKLWLEDGTILEYYRRRSDGSLMRKATLTNGEVKRWVAGPPPDLSGFTDESRIRNMLDSWWDE